MKKYDFNELGKGDHGWLKSSFHFSFANYFDRQKMHYGHLRVVNDDWVAANSGFGTHPHENMEILSYVVQGHLTHQDSMGTAETLSRGDFQYMSAGSGVSHSEYNHEEDPLHFIQIWIYPDKEEYQPTYGSKRIPFDERKNTWLHIASSQGGGGHITLHQKVNVLVTYLEAGKAIDYLPREGNGLYGLVIEGSGKLNGQDFGTGDGFSLEEHLQVRANEGLHLLIIETGLD